MKIGIIGLGIVGAALKYGFEKLGHEVVFHDIAYNTKIEDVLGSEICFVCVPTPSLENGACNTSIVESVVRQLSDLKYEGIVAIKSTVSPGTTQFLQKRYTNLEICFVPEFLRERCAITDFQNMIVLIVGTDSTEVLTKITKCHGKYPKYVKQLSFIESELIKYYSNCFNALRVIFANEMYELSKVVGADYTAIKDAYVLMGTPDVYLDCNESFRGYAGVCLPKDVKAIDHLIKSLHLDLKLFETIDNENNKFKKTVIGDMRLR